MLPLALTSAKDQATLSSYLCIIFGMSDVIVCSSIENLNPLLHSPHPKWTKPAGKHGTLDRLSDIRRTMAFNLTESVHASSSGIPLAVREVKRSELVWEIRDSADYRPSRSGNTGPGRQRPYRRWAGAHEWPSGVGLEKPTRQEPMTVEAALPAQRKRASDSFGE